MNKRNKELVIIIPLAIAVIAGITSSLISLGNIPNQYPTPETFSGVMVQYNGEWIGGNLINEGKIILLQNGTEMNYEDFKRVTGLRNP